MTTSHAHDVLSGFVDLVLRLGVSTGGLGVSFALLLSSVCTTMTTTKAKREVPVLVKSSKLCRLEDRETPRKRAWNGCARWREPEDVLGTVTHLGCCFVGVKKRS